MYSMTGKLIAQPGKREVLAKLLLQSAGLMPQIQGCRAYIIMEDLQNKDAIAVFEMWEDKDAHDASLRDERIRAVIAEARPLMAGMQTGGEFRVLGGYGA